MHIVIFCIRWLRKSGRQVPCIVVNALPPGHSYLLSLSLLHRSIDLIVSAWTEHWSHRRFLRSIAKVYDIGFGRQPPSRYANYRVETLTTIQHLQRGIDAIRHLHGLQTERGYWGRFPSMSVCTCMSYDSLCLVIVPLQSLFHCWQL